MLDKTKKTIFSEYELGWLAAAIDGEGSLTIRRYHKKAYGKTYNNRYYYMPNLNICNTSEGFIKQCYNFIGAGSIFKYTAKSGKNVWRISVSANTLRILLPKLKLIAKEDRKKILLEILELSSRDKRGCNGKFDWRSIETDKKLETIWKEMHRINTHSKGVEEQL